MDLVRHHFATIDSTNTWGKVHAHELDRSKITLITADVQTAGRGRFNRKWLSPPGQNILATFCFFVEKHRTDIGNLPQVAALAVVDTLDALGFHPQLKWPNDILLSNKKVGGILCETTPLSDTLCVILGIGLNVNMPAELLQQIDRPATSLWLEDHQQRAIQDVLDPLVTHFIHHLALFLEEGFQPFLETYKQRIIHQPGDRIRFHDNRIIWEGRFEAIASNGTLLLQLDSGEIKTFIAGEIF